MSLNDPQWGNRGGNDGDKPGGGPRRPNDGPPDLEELWRDFNRKLSSMLGKKGGAAATMVAMARACRRLISIRNFSVVALA